MDPEIALGGTFEKLALALGLGLLVGLQRQRTDSRIAGIRTFPLITVLGTVCALVAMRFGGWVLASGFLALGVIILIADARGREPSARDAGITSEVAMLLMFGIGAYLVPGHNTAAVALTGTVAVLLHLKPEMHAFARRLGDKEFRAMMRFVLISLVILPALPNRAFDLYQVLNPFKIWLLAVIIVGISLGGYVFYKFLPARAGSVVSGLLGGLISSTATAVSYARLTRESPSAAPMAALVIMTASAVVYLRALVIIGIAGPQLLPGLAGPLGAMFAMLALLSAGAWFYGRGKADAMPEPQNPAELRPAIAFALIFAVILWGTAAAHRHFGSGGLYAVAAIAGLTDMDAIVLSGVQMLQRGEIGTGDGWRMMLVASMANLVFKGTAVALLGDRKLRSRMTALFGLALAGGFLLLIAWP